MSHVAHVDVRFFLPTKIPSILMHLGGVYVPSPFPGPSISPIKGGVVAAKQANWWASLARKLWYRLEGSWALKLCELLKETVGQRHAKLKAATFSCALSQSMIAVRHLVLYNWSDTTSFRHVHFSIFQIYTP